jgi:type I restriction enzyme S subunit
MKKPVTISPEPSCFSDDEVPEGWKLVTILDACEVNPPKPSKDFLPADAPVTFVPMPAVDADLGAITNPQIKPYLEVRNGFTSFRDGDVIMAKITPCMENGKAAIVHGMKNGIGFGSTEFHVMRSRGKILPKYLYYYIRQESFRNEAESHFTGSVGQKRVPADFIKQSVIPLPPLAEQQRIVARVEALLTHINAARDRLSRVPLIMKKFRQAVLAAACSGRLTEGWREENVSQISSEVFLRQALDFRRRYYTKKSNKKYKEPVMLSDEFPFSLPDEWTWATLYQISQFVTDGDHYPPKRVPTGIPHLTSKHVKRWKLSYEDCSFISHEDYEIVKVRYEPQEGDVILTCVGTIGETAIVPEKFVFSADRNLAAIRLFPDFFLPQMLQFILNSAPWENHIKTVSGSTAQPHIYLKDLRAMAVPFPPLAEQQEIIRRVGLLFERADAFDREVAAAGRRCERLTQVVLGKAFRGELVRSD